MAQELADLDFVGTLCALEEQVRVRRSAEVEDMCLAVHWAGMHAEDPKDWPVERQHRGMARLVRLGGEGTPGVQDLCLAELATARHTHHLAARALVADALDLVHRLPRCWDVTQTLACEPWVARRVASMTRHLSAQEAAYVDRAVAAALLGEQPSVSLGVCGAKIIEANPARHQARLDEEARRTYVALGRMNEAGLRHVIAQVDAGDAMYVDALVARVAEILKVQDTATGGGPRTRDQRRAAGFAMLARPAQLLALLLEHATDPDETDTADADADEADEAHPDQARSGEARSGEACSGEARSGEACSGGAGVDREPGEPDAGPMPTPECDPDADLLTRGGRLTRHRPADPPTGTAHPNETDETAHTNESGEPEPESGTGTGAGDGVGDGPAGSGWLTGLPAAALEALRSIDPAQLRPRATLYVHLHQAALASSHPTGTGPGSVVKLEDAGPYLPQHLARLLTDTTVTVTEVVDLGGSTPVATYVHPQWLKDQVQLVSPRTCFPHSTTISRRVDYDHTVAYRHGTPGSPAPPGQTGIHNSGPLGRYQHRVKTHAQWSVREPQPGTYVWRSPHGLYRLVDATGTHRIDETLGHALFAADPEDHDRQLRILRQHTTLTIITPADLNGTLLEIADDFTPIT